MNGFNISVWMKLHMKNVHDGRLPRVESHEECALQKFGQRMGCQCASGFKIWRRMEEHMKNSHDRSDSKGS